MPDTDEVMLEWCSARLILMLILTQVACAIEWPMKYWLEAMLSDFLAAHFLVRHLVLAFVGMYCLMANGRALGLIFLNRKDELNWV